MRWIWILTTILMLPVSGWAQGSNARANIDSTTAKLAVSKTPGYVRWDRYASVDLDMALMDAVKQGQPGRVRELLARGANAQAKDVHGQTPVQWAMNKTRANMVDMLSGKTPGKQTLKSRSMWGMDRSYDEVVRLLLDARRGGVVEEKSDTSMWSAKGSALIWGGGF